MSICLSPKQLSLWLSLKLLPCLMFIVSLSFSQVVVSHLNVSLSVPEAVSDVSLSVSEAVSVSHVSLSVSKRLPSSCVSRVPVSASRLMSIL